VRAEKTKNLRKKKLRKKKLWKKTLMESYYHRMNKNVCWEHFLHQKKGHTSGITSLTLQQRIRKKPIKRWLVVIQALLDSRPEGDVTVLQWMETQSIAGKTSLKAIKNLTNYYKFL